MPFPNFDFCLLCEGIRPELGGKLNILGFYGVTPDVEVAIANPALSVTLSFLAGFPLVPDAAQVRYMGSIVITRPDQVEVLRTPPSPLIVEQGKRGFVGFSFFIPPPYPFGTYSIRILVNNEVKLDQSFRLRQLGQVEIVGLTGLPVSHGLPN
jgi:hypothetical protein